MLNKLAFLTLLSLLVGCASTPDFNTTKVDLSLTPHSVTAEPEFSFGKFALWGGTILHTINMKDSTQIEVLAYPLNSAHRPLLGKKPLGRFIIQHQGYLEPTVYSQGRLISVLGTISVSQSEHVGKSTYTYAVINSDQLYLWSHDSGRNRTSFHLGIGIRL